MPLNKKYIPDVHLNLNVSGLELSATLAINELSNKLILLGVRYIGSKPSKKIAGD